MTSHLVRLATSAAAIALLALSGCVAYPAGYGYAGAAPGYYAPAPAVVVPVYPAYGYRGGWGGGYGHYWR